MNPFNKTLIALTVTGALTGGASAAQGGNGEAASKPPAGVVVEQVIVTEQFPGEVQNGSIKIEGADEAAMAAQARISASEAAQTAVKVVPGKVVESKLDEDNGFLVWEVGVVAADGQETKLKLDAGNGRLLAVEVDDDEHQDAGREHDEHEDHADGEHSGWKFWEDNDRDERGGERG